MFSPYLWRYKQYVLYIHPVYHRQSILPKGRSFTANSGTKAAVLLKGRSPTANSGNQAEVLLGMDRCGSFPLLSATHSPFSIWSDLKRSQKIPETPAWRWGEWIWLTGPSGLYRNSSSGFFGQIGNPNHHSPLMNFLHYKNRANTKFNLVDILVSELSS